MHYIKTIKAITKFIWILKTLSSFSKAAISVLLYYYQCITVFLLISVLIRYCTLSIKVIRGIDLHVKHNCLNPIDWKPVLNDVNSDEIYVRQCCASIVRTTNILTLSFNSVWGSTGVNLGGDVVFK